MSSSQLDEAPTADDDDAMGLALPGPGSKRRKPPPKGPPKGTAKRKKVGAAAAGEEEIGGITQITSGQELKDSQATAAAAAAAAAATASSSSSSSSSAAPKTRARAKPRGKAKSSPVESLIPSSSPAPHLGVPVPVPVAMPVPVAVAGERKVRAMEFVRAFVSSHVDVAKGRDVMLGLCPSFSEPIVGCDVTDVGKRAQRRTESARKVVQTSLVLPYSFGMHTPFNSHTVYFKKTGGRGIGLKVKNIDGRVVIRGYAEDFDRRTCDVMVNDVILSCNSLDARTTSFDKILAVLRAPPSKEKSSVGLTVVDDTVCVRLARPVVDCLRPDYPPQVEEWEEYDEEEEEEEVVMAAVAEVDKAVEPAAAPSLPAAAQGKAKADGKRAKAKGRGRGRGKAALADDEEVVGVVEGMEGEEEEEETAPPPRKKAKKAKKAKKEEENVEWEVAVESGSRQGK